MIDFEIEEQPPAEVGVDELARGIAESSDAGVIRMTGYFTPEDFDVEHVREDVRDEIVAQSHEDALRDAVLETLSMEYLEKYFDDDMVGTVRVFEEKSVIYYRFSSLRGVVVSLDRGSGSPHQLLTSLEKIGR